MRAERRILLMLNWWFEALENVSEDEDINRAWEALKKISKPQLQRV